MRGTLKITNGSKVAITGVTSAFTMQGGVNAKVEVENSTLTAKDIHGNFSNGGGVSFTGSTVAIEGCENNALSVNSLTVSDSTVTVSDVGYRGIYLSDESSKLEITNNSSVTLTDCCNTTDESVSNIYEDGVAVKMSGVDTAVTFTVDSTSKLDAGEAGIQLSTNASSTADMSGEVVGKVLADENDVALVNGQGYASLGEALTAAASGGTVTLIDDAELESNLSAGVTLAVRSGMTLTVDNPTYLAVGGTLEIQAGGGLVLASETFVGGTDARLNLTSGSVTMQGTTVTLTANSAATIPSGENFYLMLGSPAGSATRLQAVVDTNATLTIDGTLTLPSGTVNGTSAKLTVNGTVNDNGLIRANSGSAIDGTGTIHVNNGGKLTVHTSTANGNAAISVSSIALSSGGEVYSEFALTDGIVGPSGNVSHSTGSYTVDGVQSGGQDVTFTNRYTYYVPSGGSSGSSGYAITVPSNIKNGDVTVSPSRATAGTVVTITVKPDAGYELDSLTVTDKNGKTVALKDIGNNKYTFTMPSGAVKIAAEFVEEAPVSTLPFTDVAATAWYYDAVEYVYDNDLMNGTASDTFAPNATLTRGMLATVLWRMEGSPVVNYALPFEDVSGDQWYTEAIRWAASVGVVNGTSATTYAPNANITREQLATMLYRYAAYKSGSVSTSASLSGFTDAGSVSDYAADAMEWAVAEEIIGGMTSTTLVPQGSATRAQTATMLMRYCENVL